MKGNIELHEEECININKSSKNSKEVGSLWYRVKSKALNRLGWFAMYLFAAIAATMKFKYLQARPVKAFPILNILDRRISCYFFRKRGEGGMVLH